MRQQLTNQEKIIQFLIVQYNKENNNSNEIPIYKSDIDEIGISEAEASRTIQLLETSNLLKIKRKSIRNDFSVSWAVSINNLCIHYFDNKKESKAEKRRKSFEEFRAWITLLISVLAFSLSIYSLYLQYAPK